MNFKTTIVLVALLAVAGIAVLFTREKEGEADKKLVESQQKVLEVQPTEVTKLVITAADGKKIALEKNAKNMAAWRLSEPVNAPAESFEVDSLIRSITGLESTSILSGSPIENPSRTIDLTTSDGKTHTLLIGEKTAVGDSLYVAKKGDSQTLVVAADLLEKISKPASTYRDPKLT